MIIIVVIMIIIIIIIIIIVIILDINIIITIIIIIIMIMIIIIIIIIIIDPNFIISPGSWGGAPETNETSTQTQSKPCQSRDRQRFFIGRRGSDL